MGTKVAQSRYEQSVNLHRQLNAGLLSPDQRLNNSSAFPDGPPKLIPQSNAGTRAQTSPGRYIQDGPPGDNNAPVTDRNPETTAATVASQFAASTSTSQMLIHVHTFPASDGNFSLSIKEDHPSDNKRLKLEDNVQPPLPQLQPLLLPFLHPDLLNQLPPLQPPFPVAQPSSRTVPPPPPFLPMPLPPPPPTTPQFVQFSSGPTTGMPFGYGSVPFPNYPMHGMQLYPTAIKYPSWKHPPPLRFPDSDVSSCSFGTPPITAVHFRAPALPGSGALPAPFRAARFSHSSAKSCDQCRDSRGSLWFLTLFPLIMPSVIQRTVRDSCRIRIHVSTVVPTSL
ncbi:hypothetical protein B296_00023961 [Ensete ventricosum]|uniref:Uncharacterized protein n=1 Tax=Ensete ventricosum TaxID=4639 RepID=A0A427AHN3_ENSVE|nr:hypothetical protein B296_00023961 [Ensete ventricosum]